MPDRNRAVSGRPSPPVDGLSDASTAWFQAEVEGLLDPALEALEDLCERADSEAVRLKAAVQIMSFAGLRPTRRRWIRSGSSQEMVAARNELEQILDQLLESAPELMSRAAEHLGGSPRTS
jgi:hypothetical protein